MTRNLYTGFRKEGLQDTISHSAEFGPTTWTTLFFSVPCICQQLLLPKYLSFSALWVLLIVFFQLSWPSVFWLSFPFLCASADSVSAPIGYLQGLSRDNKHSIIILSLALDIRAAASLWIWNFWSSGLPIWSLLLRSPQVQKTYTHKKFNLVIAWDT